jgi:type IV pilus assembly protein PilY1
VLSLPADYWNPQNDPATWPHLVDITIGIGMTGTMTLSNLPWWGNDTTSQYSSTGYTNLWAGGSANAWPQINNGAILGDLGKAYDLWHAAINSRGLAFSAESPDDLIKALKASLNRVKSQSQPGTTAVATNSTSLNSGSVIYQASFDPASWSGTLWAYPIVTTSAGSSISTTPQWATTNAGTFASAANRNILTSGTASAPASGYYVGKGLALSATDPTFPTIWSNLWLAVPAPWTSTPSTAQTDILNWVRGDQTNEIRVTAGVTTGYLRARANLLGDVVDSAPTFAWRDNYGYGALPEGGSSTPLNYSTFVSQKAGGPGAKGMVYVGANDGMLHGFDAASGAEVFAYVPASVVPNLPALANPLYAHQFYVDQTPYVGDACLGGSISGTAPIAPAGCTWKTLLIGTTGAGGRGVFALDVTNPSSMSAASVKWDLVGQPPPTSTNPTPAGDPDLGFTIGKPIIARLNSGDWAAIFGNGYLSTDGCAVLYIVNLNSGAVTKIGTTGTTGSACATPNGLGPVTLADVDGNLTTDYVYAGDQLGQLWKFDLTSTSPGSWTVAFGGTPLFTASTNGNNCAATPTTCQAITAAPALGPALQGMTGTMVYFGTGRLFAIGDASNTATQSFYGVLDQGAAISGGQGALVAQTTADVGNTRSVSANVVAPPKLGWYLNLPDSGERVTIAPLLVDGFVLFGTVVPNANSCSGGGVGWLMAVSATSKSVGGVNFFTVGTSGVDGVKSTFGVPEGFTVVQDPANKRDVVVAGGSNGTGLFSRNVNRLNGRISWHELTR